jgi:hypothetical protein
MDDPFIADLKGEIRVLNDRISTLETQVWTLAELIGDIGDRLQRPEGLTSGSYFLGPQLVKWSKKVKDHDKRRGKKNK